MVVLLALIFLTYYFWPKLHDSNSISEGIVGTYQTHDLPDSVTKLMSLSLVELDQNSRVVPKLVTGWDVNNDSTEFKFHLKNGLKWNDGTDFKAGDLEFAIPDVAVNYADDLTLVFKLKDSYAPFPALLNKPVFKKGGQLVGIGNYKIANCNFLYLFPRPCLFRSRIFITKIILEPKDINLPKVILRFYPNEKTAQTAFSIGEVQSILGISDAFKFNDSPLVNFEQSPNYSKIIMVLYNTKDPVLSNRSFRQALSFVISEIKGEADAKTSISPFSWAFNEDLADHLGDSEAAKNSLARAKQTMNEDSLKKEIVLTTTPQYEAVGRQIIGAWKELGIKAVLRVENGIPQNFQAMLIAQTIPQDPDQYPLWHSTQVKSNLGGYSSPRVDKDLEDGRKTSKEKERLEKYLDFQKVIMEDSPATFLYFPKYNYIYFKKNYSQLIKVLPLQLPK